MSHGKSLPASLQRPSQCHVSDGGICVCVMRLFHWRILSGARAEHVLRLHRRSLPQDVRVRGISQPSEPRSGPVAGYSGTKFGMEARLGIFNPRLPGPRLTGDSLEVNLNYLGTFNHDPHVVGEEWRSSGLSGSPTLRRVEDGFSIAQSQQWKAVHHLNKSLVVVGSMVQLAGFASGPS